MKKLFQKKDGYVLIWVLIVFLAAGILSTIVISTITVTMRSTDTQFNSQQAYFTAKSAASAVADYILENDGNTDIVQRLIASPGTGGSEEMGEYTVLVSYASNSKIKVKATAVFRGEKKTVSAYLVKPPIPAGIIPTDQVIFVNGSAAAGFEQCGVDGDVFIDGDFNIENGSNLKGTLVVKGKTTIKGGANTTKNVISFGNVLLDGGALINGNLMTKGDLKMSGNAIIMENAYADGSLDFSSGNSIKKDVVIGNNAIFGGGGNKILGKFTYGGSLSFGWGNIYDFVPQGGTKITNYTPLDFSKYSAPDLPIIYPPTQSEMPSLYTPVVLTNKTISNSGKLTESVISQINQLPDKPIITIDATNKDIYLLLDNTAFSLSNRSIEVIGPHNVYLYMTGTSSISINANVYVGMSVRGANPQLYIFGNGTQSISLNSTSELDACVYIPNGSLSASGDEIETYKFVGCCIVKSFFISGDVQFHYSAPNLVNTPLNIFQSNNAGSGYAGWSIESWDSN